MQNATTDIDDPLTSTDEGTYRLAADTLSEIAEIERETDAIVTADDIGRGMNQRGWDAQFRGLGRSLNDLRRAGYITRVRKGNVVGYRTEQKGWAWATL